MNELQKLAALHLAQKFAAGHVLAGDTGDKNFYQIINELKADTNEDYGICELYENCFDEPNAAAFILGLANDIEEVIQEWESINNG